MDTAFAGLLRHSKWGILANQLRDAETGKRFQKLAGATAAVDEIKFLNFSETMTMGWSGT
jgi:hypothetical protein